MINFILFNLLLLFFFYKKSHLFQEKLFIYSHKIKRKLHSIFSHFHFLHNQWPMKIIFTSSHKTYFKENTKSNILNSYVLIFLINMI